MLKERLHWGRIFAQVRGRESPRWKCLLWTMATPLLPPLLFARHSRLQLRKRRWVPEFLRVAPVTMLLLSFSALGELVGYCEAGLSPRRVSSRSV